MQWEGKYLGVLSPGESKDTWFICFGARVIANLAAWHAMIEHDLLPNTLLFLHCPLVLLFLCLYPNDKKALCALVGGPALKTAWGNTWPFSFALYLRAQLLCDTFLFVELLPYVNILNHQCKLVFLKTGRLATFLRRHYYQ